MSERTDTEMLDWLESAGGVVEHNPKYPDPERHWTVWDGAYLSFKGPSLRAAIDAAMDATPDTESEET